MRFYYVSLCILLAFGLVFDYGIIITQRSKLASSVTTSILPSPNRHYILQHKLKPTDLVRHLKVYQYVDYHEPPSYIQINHVLVPLGGRMYQRPELIHNSYTIDLDNENIQIDTHRHAFSEDAYIDSHMDRSMLSSHLQAHRLDSLTIPVTADALKVSHLARPTHLYLYGFTHPNGTFRVQAVSDDAYSLEVACIPPSILSITLLIASCLIIFCCICRDPDQF